MRDVRPWTYAALFGTLWGALEATLGTAAYLGKFPLRGTVMGVLGLLCLVCLHRLQPRPGVCLLAGTVAVFLKVFSVGGLYPGPVIGIAVQALVVEAGLTATGGHALGAALGGAAALASNPLQKLGMTWLVAGSDVVAASLRLLSDSAAAVGFGSVPAWAVFACIVAASALAGAVAGLWAWRISGRVVQRIGGRR